MGNVSVKDRVKIKASCINLRTKLRLRLAGLPRTTNVKQSRLGCIWFVKQLMGTPSPGMDGVIYK